MRRKFPVIALLILVICGAIIWIKMPPKEPVYHDKPLSYWLSAYVVSSSTNSSHPSREEAEVAIRAIGTNAIPSLLRLLQQKDSALAAFAYRLTQRQHVFNVDWEYRHAFGDALKAMEGFRALGPQSADLIPELTRVYDLDRSFYSREAVMVIISYVAPHDERAVPLLLRGLTDTNNCFVRGNAAATLGKFQQQKDVVVPALTRALGDPELFVKARAVESLAKFQSDASPAVPALLGLMKMFSVPKEQRVKLPDGIPTGPPVFGPSCTFADPVWYKTNRAGLSPGTNGVYYTVREALRYIDPKALAKAESGEAETK